MLTGPEEQVEALAGRIRSEGFRVQTRHSLDNWNPLDTVGGDITTELLVPVLAEGRVLGRLQDWGLTSPTKAIDKAPPPGEPEVADPSEGSLRTLSLLYGAADVLKHQPWNRRAIESLANAVDTLRMTKPPYGIDEDLWTQAAQLGSRLQDATAGKRSFDVISHAADALRHLLRDRI